MLKIIDKSYNWWNLDLELKFLEWSDLTNYIWNTITSYIYYWSFTKKNKWIDKFHLIESDNFIIKWSKLKLSFYIWDLAWEYVWKDIDIWYKVILKASNWSNNLVDFFNSIVPVWYTHVYESKNDDLYDITNDDINYWKVWTDMPTWFRMLFIWLLIWSIPLLLDFTNSGIFWIIMLIFAYIIYYIYSWWGYDISINTKKINDKNVKISDIIKFKSTKIITWARLEISLLNKEAYLFWKKDSNWREIEDTAIKLVNRKKIVNISMDKISKTEDFYWYVNRTKFDLNAKLREVIPNIYYNLYTLSWSILDIEIRFISDEYRDFNYSSNLIEIDNNFYTKNILKNKFKDIVNNIKLDKEVEKKIIIEKELPLNPDFLFLSDNSILENDIKDSEYSLGKIEESKIDFKDDKEIDDNIETKIILEKNKIVSNNLLDESPNNNYFWTKKNFQLNENIDIKKEDKKEINNNIINNSWMFKKSTLFDK